MTLESPNTRDRRRSDRLAVRPSLPARLGQQDVRLVEIDLNGTRVEHDHPFVGSPKSTLTFEFEGEELTVDCAVVHSEELLLPEAKRYQSGIRFSETGSGPLRRVVSTISDREELHRLKTLVEASKLINSSIEPAALLESILTVARNELSVERGTLYFVDEGKKEIWAKIAGGLGQEIRLPFGHGLAGAVAASGEPEIIRDAYSDPRFDQSTDQRSGFRTRSMLVAPIRSRDDRVVGVLQLLNKTDGSFGRRDLDFLASISDHMAIAMENARMHVEIVQKQRMERELQLGREIQSRLFPLPPSDISGIELAAQSIPCYEVGGDYYDFLELPNGDLGLVIGDVSGKGVSAALVMSSLQAALRLAAPIEPDLAVLVARLNALIHRMTRGRKYVTFFLGRYTPSTGELQYVNAGHNPPVLSCNGKVENLVSTGKPIGILPDSTFVASSVQVDPGSTLFLYTDGLNEAANLEEEEFGNDRLFALFRSVTSLPPDRIHEGVFEELTRFENGAPATDDKTLVVLRRV